MRITNVKRRRCGGRVAPRSIFVLLTVLGGTGGGWLSPGPARADGCATNAYDNGTVSLAYLWPNWTKTRVASFDVQVCYGCGFANEIIQGLTVVNFGSAGSGDFKGVFATISCDTANSGYLTLTYAGNYQADSGTYPAWTWAGASPNLGGCAAPCPTCEQVFTIDLYVDVDDCPTDQATVELGFPIRTAGLYVGSISDNQGCKVPWYDMTAGRQTLVHVLKDGPQTAAPGDTVTYTVIYGRPGTAAYTNIVIMDTLPPYTHYVPGIGNAPDPGYNPDPGPPARLMWTLAGGAPGWGGTSQITFAVTVDWGNGESFEPGSGDVAAPENQRLDNSAAVSWIAGNCPVNTVSSQPARTTVRRYLFWKLADNDILFAGKIGMPDDEITYSLFVKNVSASKTWWDVQLWDTVPAEVDAWGPGSGFDDPCSGWTMTPSGCAAASPGRLVGGGRTLLTWNLDMPPQMTLELRWKARVVPSVTAGATASNSASVMALGRAGIAGGTGHAGRPRIFIHDAAIILRTTYFAYGAYGYQCTESTQTSGQALHIHFFPLNKMTNFSLYKQENVNNVFANVGGVSPPIAVFAGTCVGGFGDGGWAGCKAERIPASYWPVAYDNTFPIGGVYPSHFFYKVISNSPFVWELMTNHEDESADSWGWVTGASLTFSSKIHYSFMMISYDNQPRDDMFFVFNPSDTLETTELLFRWNPGTLVWDFLEIVEMDPGAVWGNMTAYLYNQGTPNYVWNEQSYRLISSQVNTLVWREAYNGNSQRGIYSPIAETGLLVSKAGAASTFYSFVFRQGWTGAETNLAVTNLGGASCDYVIDLYTPGGLFFTPNPRGSWNQIWAGNVPAGIANAGNPDVYGAGYIAGILPTTFGNPVPGIGQPHWFTRVRQATTDCALQVMMGADLSGSFSSGGILHDITGKKSGVEFWLSQTSYNFAASKSCSGTNPTEIYTIDVFCPSAGMAPRLRSYQNGPGYDSTYTTTALDEVVSFRGLTGFQGANLKRNWQITVGGPPADAVVQFIQAQISEKYYTMPFVSTGVYYNIIAPPVVYVGQSFWLTVVVVNVGGQTKTDYCGTTSFTSTDPNGKLEGTALDTYNYVWDSNVGSGCGVSPFDNGVKVFVNVSFIRLGLVTIIANDTLDGSITGLATVNVVGADVRLTKEQRLTIAASNDTVQFRICWSNYSSASAFTFVMNDAIPRGTNFLPEAGTWGLDCGNTTGLGMAVSYSTATTPTVPAAASFAAGNPTAATRWLRWTVPYVGVNTTGCACFRVTVQ